MRWRCPSLPLFLLFSSLTLFVGTATVSGFRICSYNVQRFGPNKMANHRIRYTLTRVVSRCDICLLQNVVDPTGEAINSLLSSLNRRDKYRYQSVSSGSLGNSSADMQQYVFLYRAQSVAVTGRYQYENNQSFVRPPFVVQFHSNKTEIKDFILVPLHSDPDRAVQEIDQLYEVFQAVIKKWNNKNVMFLGDFHAACAYVTRSDKINIRLFTNTNFTWLIGDKVDTTVMGKVSCAYDRIVVYGQPFLEAIIPFSAQVFNLAKEFKIPNTKVLEVSDHFPVEVTLKSSALLPQITPLLILLSVSALMQSFMSAL
uniref:Deoxyribonuclease n=1 Tax=Monopterus albus TaxID=43700 RepID=A0A3Q3K7M2_MONAL|nr:deoxyribonuclease-1-like isoform X2 [Monopterus albus]